MLRIHAPLIDARQASSLAIEAAVAAMAPATKAAITADLKCYLAWCWSRHPRITAIPAAPETLVHYLRWLEKGSDTRAPAKAATLARRIASIARMHRILGFGDKEPLPTQAGMVRDTLKCLHLALGRGEQMGATSCDWSIFWRPDAGYEVARRATCRNHHVPDRFPAVIVQASRDEHVVDAVNRTILIWMPFRSSVCRVVAGAISVIETHAVSSERQHIFALILRHLYPFQPAWIKLGSRPWLM